MSSTLKKLERNIVKNQGSANSLKEKWDKFRVAKYGEGNVPCNTMKKKQVHFNSSDQYIRAWDWQKNMIKAYMDSRKAEKESAEITSEQN
jgi:hypothetical protein